MDALAAKRARLVEVERELARLRYRHDIAMSAFRFEEATALGPTIAALEKERQALTAISVLTAFLAWRFGGRKS